MERIKKEKRKSPINFILILFLIFLFAGVACADNPQREISVSVVNELATLESVSVSENDVLLFEIDMSEASITVSHTDPRAQEFTASFKLLRLVEVEEDDGWDKVVVSTEIGGREYSAKSYNAVLQGVDGKGVEVRWVLRNESRLKLNLELFSRGIAYEGVGYGSTRARIRFSLDDYTFVRDDSEIALEAEVLSPHWDLSWEDTDDFQEVLISSPNTDLVLGFPDEIEDEETTQEASYLHEGIEGGIAFLANYGRSKDISWYGFCRVDMKALDEEEGEWHPVGDTTLFGSTLLISSVILILIKLRYLRIGGHLKR